MKLLKTTRNNKFTHDLMRHLSPKDAICWTVQYVCILTIRIYERNDETVTTSPKRSGENNHLISSIPQCCVLLMNAKCHSARSISNLGDWSSFTCRLAAVLRSAHFLLRTASVHSRIAVIEKQLFMITTSYQQHAYSQGVKNIIDYTYVK